MKLKTHFEDTTIFGLVYVKHFMEDPFSSQSISPTPILAQLALCPASMMGVMSGENEFETICFSGS